MYRFPLFLLLVLTAVKFVKPSLDDDKKARTEDTLPESITVEPVLPTQDHQTKPENITVSDTIIDDDDIPEDTCKTAAPTNCLKHIPIVIPLSYIPEIDSYNYAMLWKCDESGDVKITVNPASEFGRLTLSDFVKLQSPEVKNQINWAVALLNRTQGYGKVIHNHNVFDPLYSCRFRGDHYCTESHILKMYDTTNCHTSWKNFYEIAVTHDKYGRVYWRTYPNILDYRDLIDGVYANKTSDLLGKLLRKEIDFPQS